MCPDALQFLTTWRAHVEGAARLDGAGAAVARPGAGRRAIIMLDQMSTAAHPRPRPGHRQGRVDGFRAEMAQARQQFKESAEALTALETGVMEYDGEYVHQPRIELHPAPFVVQGRTYRPPSRLSRPRSWPSSALACSSCRRSRGTRRGGDGPYRTIYGRPTASRRHRSSPAGPTSTRTPTGPRRTRALAPGYWDSVIDHYEFDKPHLKSTPGYEFHGQMYDRLTAPGGPEKMTEFYIGLQPWGTPEQVFEKVRTFCDLVGGDSYLGVFRYGGMPPAEAEKSMRLFAKEVMPELQKIGPAIERLEHIRG
jgi:hypothetical protein